MKRDILMLSGSIATGIVVGVVVFAASSSPILDMSAISAQPAAAIVPFTEIKSGTQSKVTERVNYLITSADELQSLWTLINATGTPPTLDFSKQAIMAIFAGQQIVAGSRAVVSKIEDAASRLVSITVVRPEGSCAKKIATTTPYQLIAVPATTLPLAHEDVMTTTVCP